MELDRYRRVLVDTEETLKRIWLIALAACGASLCTFTSTNAAQIVVDSISPEDSAQAENAPLFQSYEPLELTLEGNLKELKKDRSDDADEHPANFMFPDPDGGLVTMPVKLRTRGNWRRQKRNCNFPNFRLNLPKGKVGNTVFDGQDKLKVVTPCRDNRDDYQQYILQEYLAYRIYNLLTDVSLRVRLAHMTYIDTAGDPDTLTKYVFLIEHVDQLAARHRMTLLDMQGIHHEMVDQDLMTLTLVYQYLIGNTDWSVSGLHNTMLLVDEEQIPIAIPFDFDWTGVVNPRYGSPPPHLGIRTLRDRLWRGYCQPEEITWAELAPVFELVSERKDAIYALFTDQEGLDEKRLKDTHKYLDAFYETINDRRKVRREFIDTCRD